ncbi:FAD-binding oxidoreductase [Variovorax dokdonensis]|uniref:FAD-binding oxidoreductase n=1 Tax=Variovorax dokdonensis TaxID=344883 RepID=A0ABT7NAR4_9BURK|nr:FAD-binding oxidoreductase [Variovorax dokdonensis]MDM0045032.1 FAD-binding oxidoreductase [Variovorax dokdonensis]
MSTGAIAPAEVFRSGLGVQGVFVDAADKEPYERSARHGGGDAVGVLRPGSEKELAWTVGMASQLGVLVVVQGAATGLVSAATPTADGRQWVLSTQRVRDVLEVDPINRSVRVSAGYRLSDVNRAAAEVGLAFPIDLGADPTIGGMIATNTGGARLIRYGGVRENLLDVRAALLEPAAVVVGSDRALRKDNTGLNWPQLLCGTFGAFGVVTRATLKLHPIQRQSATALVAVSDAKAAVHLMCELEAEFGEMISAFEGLSAGALDAVRQHQKNVTVPFATTPPYAVLVEVSSAIPPGRGLDLEAMMMAWLERRMEEGDLEDAVVDKPAQLWRIRHSVSEAVQSLGKMVAFDLAVSRSRFAEFRDAALEAVAKIVPAAMLCDFGHLGDGGAHLNLVVPAETAPEQIAELRDAIYDLTVLRFEGSYSAEHGIGPYNETYYRRYADPQTRQLATLLKSRFDPNGLLGNVDLG